MDEGYEGEDLDNIVILNDEDGNEVKFEFLDLVELDDEEYVILLPVIDDGVEEEGEVVILKVIPIMDLCDGSERQTPPYRCAHSCGKTPPPGRPDPGWCMKTPLPPAPAARPCAWPA